MTDSEVRKLIREVIRQELAQALMGVTVSNQDQLYSKTQRFDESPIPNVRKLLPYGLSSRAPSNTQGLITPVNGDPSHLVVVGDFDVARPTGADGETLLYDQFGHVVYLSEDKMQFGSKTSDENMVLGQVFKSMMDTLLTAIESHTHVGNLGYSTSPPQNAVDFAAIKASPIDDELILSDKAFTEK